MLTITRRLASRLRAVCRRAFGNRGPFPNLCFTSSRDGLAVRVKSTDVAVEHRGGTGGPPETLWVPFQALLDCEAKRDDSVQFESQGDGRLTVQWQDHGVPQIMYYDGMEPANAGQFPGLPERFAPNPASLIDALLEAADTTDPFSTRFALGCVQVRGKGGTLAATNGTELLVQSGFTFPWEEDLLVPKGKILGSPEFRGPETIEIGRAGDWVAFRTGEWTIWLEILKDGRFPDVSQHIPRAADAVATCHLSPADVRFLAETLPRLPSDDTLNHPITVDLNGAVAIRAKPADQDRVTELLLSNSSWSGEPVRINTNRQYLLRAAGMGFDQVHFYGPNRPVFCEDGRRQYVWMVLDPETTIPPLKNPIRIESPADPAGAVPQPTTRRTEVPKSNHEPEAASRNGQNHTPAAATSAVATPQQSTGAIEQAIALRDSLREAANRATELIRTLQQERKQVRQLRNALASLREIQKLKL